MSTATRPNILFCISDDQSWPHASAYGCTWVNTPGFDRVAREGVLFNNAYTHNAKCAPSRAGILTGRYSWQLEEACNHFCYFPEKFDVFTEMLGGQGYAVGFTGKGWAPGNPGYKPDGSPRELTGKAYQQHTLTPPAGCMSNRDYAANFEQFLDERPADAPFCFWYGGHEPHRPYEFGSGVKVGGKRPEDVDAVPPYWPECEDVRTDMLDYAFQTEWFDSHVVRMLDALEARGQLANTLVVVTSDNGMPFPRIKGQNYEMAYHLPLAVMWPECAPGGRVVDDFVNFIDFAPTFLEAAGLPAHAPMSGKSFMDVLTAETSGLVDADRTVLFAGKERHDIGRPNNVGYPIRTIHEGRWLYLHNFEPERWPAGDPEVFYRNCDDSPTKTLVVEAMEQGDDSYWRLCMGKRPAEELYDTEADPHCVTNLAADPAFTELKDRLRERLFAALTEQGDPRMHGHPDIFDTYDYIGVDAVAMVYRMWQKVKASGGAFKYKRVSDPDLR